jgi:hypothetical protein
VVQAGDQVSSDLAGEVVVLNLATGVYYGLEGVGARVWGLLREPITVGTIVETLLAEYEIDRETCRRDVEELLERLASERMIELRDASDPSA